jgi:hypothetical protein
MEKSIFDNASEGEETDCENVFWHKIKIRDENKMRRFFNFLLLRINCLR